MFIYWSFLANEPIRKAGVESIMINPISSASVVSHAVVPQNAPQSKPQPPASSDQQDSVQLSPKAQAQASGDVDHDGDSH